MTSKDEFFDFLARTLRSEIHPTGSIKRSVLFAKYREAFPDAPPEEPGLALEDLETQLRKGLFSEDLRISFDAVSDNFSAERSPTSDLVFRLEEVAAHAVDQNLRKLLLGLDGRQFQRVVTEVFRLLPWIRRVGAVAETRDGGIDLELVYKQEGLGDIVALGQVKRTTGKTSSPEIRDLIGALTTRKPKADLGLFISTAGYSKDALDTIKRSPTRIQNYELTDLIGWLRTYSIGVRRETVGMEFLDEVFWNEALSK